LNAQTTVLPLYTAASVADSWTTSLWQISLSVTTSGAEPWIAAAASGTDCPPS
jgi:hypothetical protein